MTVREKAVEFHTEGLNCAQSVLCALEDYTQLPRETAKKIAEGFGGSLGKVVAVSNKPVEEFGGTVLGARGGVMRGMRRAKSLPAYDILMANSPSESKMNIADSVSVSAYLAIMAEIE